MTSEELAPGAFVNDDRRLRTTRLSLRRLRPDDAEPIACQANDRGVAQMTARIPHPYSLADARAFVADPGDEFIRAVVLPADQRLIGVAGLKPRPDGTAVSLGYWFGREHWGKGYATEVVQALVDFAFVSSDIACVCASCRVINGASRRVLEKCGFQLRRTGILDTASAGRVSVEEYHLDRGTWTALKAWGGK